MARSSQYVTLLKKLIDATQQDEREVFEREIEEIRGFMDELDDDERFDLEINIKTETKSFYDRLD